MAQQDTERDLADVRRAAFELRQRDPAEAVRVLRTVARRGSEVEALAHGALGEILLDEFDDVDAALHHFRRLLALAPGVPAGELGLARALARQGDARDAQQAYARALTGLEKAVREAIAAGPEADLAGAEESVLTALELAIEERDLASEAQTGAALTHPAAELLDWAEAERVFDPAEDEDAGDIEDWVRFAQLRALLLALDGRREQALATIDRLARAVPLPAEAVPRIRSLALEASRDPAAAAREAMLAVGELGEATDPLEVLRAADLFAAAQDLEAARRLLEPLRELLQARRKATRDAATAKEIDRVLEDVDARLEGAPRPTLVTLGSGLGRRPK